MQEKGPECRVNRAADGPSAGIVVKSIDSSQSENEDTVVKF